jgi:hypothetical protein
MLLDGGLVIVSHSLLRAIDKSAIYNQIAIGSPMRTMSVTAPPKTATKDCRAGSADFPLLPLTASGLVEGPPDRFSSANKLGEIERGRSASVAPPTAAD